MKIIKDNRRNNDRMFKNKDWYEYELRDDLDQHKSRESKKKKRRIKIPYLFYPLIVILSIRWFHKTCLSEKVIVCSADNLIRNLSTVFLIILVSYFILHFKLIFWKDD